MRGGNSTWKRLDAPEGAVMVMPDKARNAAGYCPQGRVTPYGTASAAPPGS